MSLGHQPDLAAAHLRALSLRKLRDFFSERQVLEVETPVLSRGISLDCHIDVFSSDYHSLGYPQLNASSETFFLQSSPEPHMKRLLCAGFPDIYQISKSFRNGESGGQHNPEFSMIEWYRKGFSLGQLMEEVADLCQVLAGPLPVLKRTYGEVFATALGMDPLDFDLSSLVRMPALSGRLPEKFSFRTKTEALEYLMAHIVEPGFPTNAFTFVHEFPADQAAQAQVIPENPRLAYRFEVYGGGMELGNGYLELLDSKEYELRFDLENAKRARLGKPELPKDLNLLKALKTGLPPCSGVAMGLDRLLMLRMKSTRIGSTLNFPWGTC